MLSCLGTVLPDLGLWATENSTAAVSKLLCVGCSVVSFKLRFGTRPYPRNLDVWILKVLLILNTPLLKTVSDFLVLGIETLVPSVAQIRVLHSFQLCQTLSSRRGLRHLSLCREPESLLFAIPLLPFKKLWLALQPVDQATMCFHISLHYVLKDFLGVFVLCFISSIMVEAMSLFISLTMECTYIARM